MFSLSELAANKHTKVVLFEEKDRLEEKYRLKKYLGDTEPDFQVYLDALQACLSCFRIPYSLISVS